MFAASELPSANTPCRDILFPLLIRGRKAADCGRSWQIVRTMRTGSRPVSGRFSSLSAHFLRSNRTTAILVRMLKADNSNGWMGPEGGRFEKLPLGRSEPGSNLLVHCVCFRPHSGPSWGGFDRLVVDPKRPSREPAAAIGRDPLFRAPGAGDRKAVSPRPAWSGRLSWREVGRGTRLCGTSPLKLVPSGCHPSGTNTQNHCAAQAD
jgi:hypothetical protein